MFWFIYSFLRENATGLPSQISVSGEDSAQERSYYAYGDLRFCYSFSGRSATLDVDLIGCGKHSYAYYFGVNGEKVTIQCKLTI